MSGFEVVGDVEVAAQSRLGRAASVVILEDGEESRLVANICDLVVVQVVQAVNELLWAAEGADQFGLIVWNKERVFPDTAFEGLRSVVLE